MKKIFYKILCSFLTILVIFTTTNVVMAKDETPNLSFLAMSDIHLDDLLFQTDHSNMDQFKLVLDSTKDLGLDLFIGGGDYSSYGNKKYWYLSKQLVQEAGFEKSIWAIGNHEYGTTGLRFLAKSKFKSFTGESELYYTKVVNGYYFIVLGAESGIVGTYGKMSSAQKKWFNKTLKNAVEKSNGKPIFIISHYSLENGNVSKEIGNVIKNYDNVIFLWGHEHDGEYADMTFEQCINEDNGFVSARMGSVHYYNNDNADGLIVRIYDDRVELQMKRVDGKIFEDDTYTYQLVR